MKEKLNTEMTIYIKNSKKKGEGKSKLYYVVKKKKKKKRKMRTRKYIRGMLLFFSIFQIKPSFRFIQVGRFYFSLHTVSVYTQNVNVEFWIKYKGVCRDLS